ncbi:hypothetical protein EDB81DRAFT_878835 [Dactylonectria macrodidyma]|uniref:Uncharacterized protein n=1 Tax=Dactylonectria macrodidyma TaxID=307937 RepID=A0A9P9JFZ7_9HYPO|nr:hypothetical protein EDB81DRAFT_878835 [Dactylonectria macrodidyma]
MASSQSPNPSHRPNPPNPPHTSYPLVAPDLPEWDKDPWIAGLAISKMLVNLFYLSRHLDNIPDLPYGPECFVLLARRYIAIYEHALASIQSIIADNPLLKSALSFRKKEVVELQSIHDTITLGIHKTRELLVEDFGEEDDAFKFDFHSTVANVSLREVRLWCQLNTTTFHKSLNDRNGDLSVLRAFIAEQISERISATQSRDDITAAYFEELYIDDKKSKPNISTPLVYFICTGLQENGHRIHDLLHKARLEELMELEKGDAAKETKEKWRKSIMLGDLGALPPDLVQQANGLLANPLRACASHLGQAFCHKGWDEVKEINCCYICKISVRYTEMQKDTLDITKNTRLSRRVAVPHSCAEVPASAHCDPASLEKLENMASLQKND